MDIVREKEILDDLIVNGKEMTTELVEEIFADRGLTEGVHPLIALACNWLLEREKGKAEHGVT